MQQSADRNDNEQDNKNDQCPGAKNNTVGDSYKSERNSIGTERIRSCRR